MKRTEPMDDGLRTLRTEAWLWATSLLVLGSLGLFLNIRQCLIGGVDLYGAVVFLLAVFTIGAGVAKVTDAQKYHRMLRDLDVLGRQ